MFCRVYSNINQLTYTTFKETLPATVTCTLKAQIYIQSFAENRSPNSYIFLKKYLESQHAPVSQTGLADDHQKHY